MPWRPTVLIACIALCLTGPRAAHADGKMTLADVKTLKELGYGDAEILTELKRAKAAFPDVRDDQLAALKSAGIGARVLDYIRSTRRVRFGLAQLVTQSQQGASVETLIARIAEAKLVVALSPAQSIELTRKGVHAAVLLALRRQALGERELQLLARRKTAPPAYMALARLVGVRETIAPDAALRLVKAGVPMSVLKLLRSMRPTTTEPPTPTPVPTPTPAEDDSVTAAKTANAAGLKLLRARKLDEAVAAFTRAIALNPRFAVAYFNRGLARRLAKQYTAAEADFTKAIALDSRDVDFYNQRGLCRLMMGKREPAIADFSAALQRAPKRAVLYYNRGFAYKALGRKAEAIADFTEFLALDPKSESAAEVRKWIGELRGGGNQ